MFDLRFAVGTIYEKKKKIEFFNEHKILTALLHCLLLLSTQLYNYIKLIINFAYRLL